MSTMKTAWAVRAFRNAGHARNDRYARDAKGGSIDSRSRGDGCYRHTSKASDASDVGKVATTIDACPCNMGARRLATRLNCEAAEDAPNAELACLLRVSQEGPPLLGAWIRVANLAEGALGAILGRPCQLAREALAWTSPSSPRPLPGRPPRGPCRG